MRQSTLSVYLLLATLVFLSAAEEDKHKHHGQHHGKHHGHHNHHGHHGHGHHHKHHKSEVHHTADATASDSVAKMKGVSIAKANVAVKSAQTRTKAGTEMKSGQLEVNGPVPADFAKVFAQGVAKATGCDPSAVTVSNTASQGDGLDQINFQAPRDVVSAVEDQAADPDSKLANGALRLFLVARESATVSGEAQAQSSSSTCLQEPCDEEMPKTPVAEKGIDIDTAMPYGDLEPFGREDTAQELTESSVKESDEMVDQLERAEVAEEKRAVFRALTRLRGAAITSFDGVARSQTGNIDEYNKVHKWRSTHPLHHLADEESDITKWAFPDNADF